MKEKVLRRVFAAFAAAAAAFAMCASVATPAFAANTSVSGSTTTFDKYLVMDADTNVPNVTFEFDIMAGTAQVASGGSPAIYAGVTPDLISISKASFTTSDSTILGTPSNKEDSAQKYATKSVTVDLQGVTFNKPGIYRYVITETATSQDGITNDTNTTRTLDVHVAYAEGSETELEVTSYALHPSDDSSKKADGFTNTYATHNLTLEKQVTGNQGDRNKYFKFTVSITNAVKGTVYNVDLTNADSNPNVNDGTTNSNQLVATDGTVTATYYLKNDQSITIKGLTGGTHYAITEESYSSDGYTTANTVDGTASLQGDTTGEKTMDDSFHEVVFTNHKEGIVPTGILIETGPYILMGAVVVIGLVALLATGRRRSRK